jgi:cytochrome oxidase Cu insertion factor (SCO1/SenC/PrrC family)
MSSELDLRDHPQTGAGDPPPGGGPEASAAAGHEPGGGVDVRAAAFAAGPPAPFPTRLILWIAGIAAFLGIGGAVVGHFVDGVAATGSTTATTGTIPPPLNPPARRPVTTGPATVAPNAPGGPSLSGSLSSMMDLTSPPPVPATGFSLTDQRGSTVSLASLRGKVVVLSFFNQTCDDICPVLAAELAAADADLGPAAAHVALVTVNTDPRATRPATGPAPAGEAPVSGLSNFYELTGSLDQLDPVWKAYGITIDVQVRTGRIAHNDKLYFVDPRGRLRAAATPFANESTGGAFSLPAAAVARWGAGIADEVRSLEGGTRR